MKWIAWPFAKIRPFKISRHLGFDITRNSAIRSTDPENPTLEPNMKCIGSLVAEIWRIVGHMGPHLGGRRRLRGSAMVPFERAIVVSYKLSIVTIALSVTIRLQFAIVCLQRSNQQVVGHFGPQFPVTRSMMFGSAESERPTLANSEIIFEEFQPMWSQSTNVTDRRTDDMQSKDRALHCSASSGN